MNMERARFKARQALPVTGKEVLALFKEVEALQLRIKEQEANISRMQNTMSNMSMGFADKLKAARAEALEEAAAYCYWHQMGTPYGKTKPTHDIFVSQKWGQFIEETQGRHAGHGYAEAIRQLKGNNQ